MFCFHGPTKHSQPPAVDCRSVGSASRDRTVQRAAASLRVRFSVPCAGGLRQDQTTSATPNLLAAHRTVLPDDPVEHAHGKVGNSNRWWYVPGMYKPISQAKIKNTCKIPKQKVQHPFDKLLKKFHPYESTPTRSLKALKSITRSKNNENFTSPKNTILQNSCLKKPKNSI